MSSQLRRGLFCPKSFLTKNTDVKCGTTFSYSSVGGGDDTPPKLSYEDVTSIRKTHLNPSLVTYYKQPVYITRGDMQYLWDQNGKRYLDLFGGIVTVSVGHCHPRVNEALESQIKQLWHTTSIYMYESVHKYAKNLVDTFPKGSGLEVVHFVNSGSEANDLAMVMARLYTGNHDIIALQNAYHGMSPYTMGLTGQGTWKFKLPGSNSGIHHVPNPDCFGGVVAWEESAEGPVCRDSPVQPKILDKTKIRLRTSSKDTSENDADKKSPLADFYVQQFENTLKHCVPSKNGLAAFFAESIQGVGGTVQYPIGYLKKVYERVRHMGGVCVADEVQTGFGRTGDHFWGFEGHNVTPDIVTMAKGMGNGFPIAAVVTTAEIAEVMKDALHFNTFGGNPMSCAVGQAVLNVLKEDRCQENSKEVGTYFLQSLAALRDKYQIIGDVRGKGLMIGVELVQYDNGECKPLNTAQMANIFESCKDMGLLLGKGGLHGNILRIKPPMCINKRDVDESVTVMENAIQKYGN